MLCILPAQRIFADEAPISTSKRCFLAQRACDFPALDNQIVEDCSILLVRKSVVLSVEIVVRTVNFIGELLGIIHDLPRLFSRYDPLFRFKPFNLVDYSLQWGKRGPNPVLGNLPKSTANTLAGKVGADLRALLGIAHDHRCPNKQTTQYPLANCDHNRLPLIAPKAGA